MLALHSLSDDALLSSLTAVVGTSRRLESELVAHIAEVDRRRLYLREATPSMFAYCTEVLHLSEHEAYMRIAVGRAAHKHPLLLTMLRDGRLHLSAIARLAPHLDPLDAVGREQLLTRATHGSRRHVEELVAALSAEPDVPATIRKLPERREAAAADAESMPQLGPDRVDASAPSTRPAPVQSATVQPLAPARYKISFTGSAELREKLDRLGSLLPRCDLAAIIETAVTEKLQRAEARRFGRIRNPRKSLGATDTSPGSRHIPASVRRVVVERDAGRCTFVNAGGNRCRARVGLEFHHGKAYALGGDRSPENIHLLCRAHNGHLAESTFGKHVMRRYRREGLSEPARSYG